VCRFVSTNVELKFVILKFSVIFFSADSSQNREVVFEGDEVTRVYFVQTGRIKILKITAGSKKLITGLYGPGEFFGYLTLLEGTPHRNSAVAVDDSELIYVPQDDFSQLLLRNREVSQ